MTDPVENIIREHLLSLRNDLRDFQSEIRQDFKDLKQRMSGVESAVLAALTRPQAGRQTSHWDRPHSGQGR